ncbi:glycosyltransferase family 2 protein [Spirosoma utsteinense]|uniref:GT2 family glycosyltransferase n=1 Tax=Spirosoma utsteinense TaxID=2585773 RepID=A0ABR6W7N7_9BACT|nr:glycosyltransferase family 2 protein [Spirosoma utsteinense]MBC3783959.1 GT2 family glycosyltransferase [Spirosoma utsteinense]MBC3792593.1 GT2 family glycosyltransferase [Spirosoma utsteinense]
MIYIVIPVHNRKAFTLGCLHCLAQQTVTDRLVIVVDDGSTDGTGEQVRKQFPDVVVLTGNGSLWWAGATNLGVRYVLDTLDPDADDFILTLNDDISINSGYLANLLIASKANQRCLIGSVSVDVKPPHALLYAGTRHNFLVAKIEDQATTRFTNKYASLLQNSSCIGSDSLPGRGMLVPIPVFRAIGVFDDRRFCHHMADLDFSIRARKAGFPLLISSASVVYEYSDATGVDVSKPMSLRLFWQALSAIKSPINYQVRHHFALKHAPFPYLYIGIDMLRIIGGYVIRQIKATLAMDR